MERIAQLYKELTGREPQRITPLAGAGSNRQYFRVEGEGESLIAVIGTNQEENEAFIDLSKRFKQGNLPVPAVLAVSDDHMVYLQEDCGDLSLSAFMAQHRQEDGTLDEIALDALKATIRELPRFQFLPIVSQTASEFFTHCFPQQEMDRTSVMFDLNYFKYCFLKLKGVEFNEFKLQQDFEKLADDLLMEQADTFLYRDFQSRNIMLKDGKPYFIDFQGGRRGPIYYDVASFLWQSSAKFSDDVRNLLIEDYLQALNCQLSTLNSQLDAYRKRLVDRFGAIPDVAEELIQVVPLRVLGKQLGIEKILLKQQNMYLYFVSNPDSPYFQSEAFGSILNYVSKHPRQCNFREAKGKRSVVITNVPSVASALTICRAIATE